MFKNNNKPKQKKRVPYCPHFPSWTPVEPLFSSACSAGTGALLTLALCLQRHKHKAYARWSEGGNKTKEESRGEGWGCRHQTGGPYSFLLTA